MGIAYGSIKTIAELKAAKITDTVKNRGKQPGSYTIIFDEGYKYHGKGPLYRMFDSAIQQSVNHVTFVKSMQWTPSVSDRESFKDEYRRMQTDATFNIKTQRSYDQGYQNPINFNIRQSYGYGYILQDGF